MPNRVARRHRQLLDYFGENGVAQERARYDRSITMRYRLELIERFLKRHLRGRVRSCLEIGPGPGRFSELLSRHCEDLVLLDLSRPMLEASRRRFRHRRPRRVLPELVRASIENLPFRARTFDRVVALGVLVFVAKDLAPVLRNIAKLLRPDGLLLAEFRTPTGDTMSIFPSSPEGARIILREPSRYHLWSVVRRGYQPYDPEHLAPFEVGWLRPHQLEAALARAGLTPVDTMTVGPNFSNQPQLLKRLRREPRAYANALRLEEETGRWPELLGAGAGLLVAAATRPS